MTRETLTDAEIEGLIKQPKKLSPFGIKFESKNNTWSAKVVLVGAKHFFLRLLKREPCFFLYWRFNLESESDFSCGLRVDFSDGSKVSLMRCDGRHNSPHFNFLERERIDGPHVHQATERYIKRYNRQDDGWAQPAGNAYCNAVGALKYLLVQCRINTRKEELLWTRI